MANYQQSSRNITLFVTNIRQEGKLMKFHSLNDYARDQVQKLERLFVEKAEELERLPSYLRNYQIPHGCQCCVKSRIKQQWCRACVLPVDVGIQQVAVLLVDYGNREVVPVTDVRSAESIVPAIPPLATECILADVAPARGETWSSEAMKFCEQHLLYQNLSGYIVTEYHGVPVVRVAKLGESEPFVQRLIDSSLAKIEEIVVVPKPDVFPGPGFKSLTLELNTTHLVTVSCIITPQHFYVQLSAAEVELKNLMDSIERCASYEQLGNVTVPKTGLACLAQHNQNYYRAMIQDVKQGICKVLLVDYGYILNKYLRELRAIPMNFISLPAQAIGCMLVDAQVKREDFIAAKKISPYLMCQVLGARGDFYIVNLLHNGENILKALQQPAVTSYCVQPLTVGTTLDVTPSYVCSSREFYCQITSCKEDLDIITRKLKPADGFEIVSVKDIVPGLVACARFSEDRLWYRAKVLAVHEGNIIEVFFVDFGNTDKVKLPDIRTMPNNLLAHPVHAYKFGLYGFGEVNLSDDIIEWFETITMENDLRAEIKSVTKDDFYSVVLYVENGTGSINDMLKKKLLQPMSLSIQLSNPETLYVTSFEPPAQFFGQMTRFDQDTLTRLQEEINSYCSRSKSVAKVDVGDVVCAKFSEDNEFYRARVESLAPAGCYVFFVDYGNRSYVKMKDICEISGKYLSHPFFGVECIIDNCPSAVSSALESALLEREVQVRPLKELSPGKWQVAFVESFGENANILKLLTSHSVQGGLNTSNKVPVMEQNSNWTCNTEKSVSHPAETYNHSVHTNSSDKSQADALNRNLVDYDEMLVPHGSFKEIFVSYVKSPSEFYCQMIHESSELQQLMEKLNQMYSCLKPTEMRLEKKKVGAPCCAIYEEDSMWYRAKIVNLYSDKCDVFFVDYGNTQEAHITKVKALHPDFFSTPTQALKCSLFNTVPESGSWKASDIDAFMEMASEKSFVAQFVKTESNGTHLVNLVDINKLKDGVLSKDFVKLGHGQLEDSNKLLVVNSVVASTSLAYDEPDIELGAKEVVVTWVTDAVQFFCQIKANFPSFKAMMEKIQSHYGKKSVNEDAIDRPHTGMICVGQFTEDGAWYRARIVDVQKSTVRVYYVDYGNEEQIKRNSVKYILQDFTSLPVQAVKCRLQGLCESAKTLPDSLPSFFEGKAICTFISKQDDHFIVDLECGNKNVAQEMVALHLASSDKVASDENANLSSIPNNVCSFQKDQLVNVIVSFIESPRRFWCQLEDSSEQLDEIMAGIETYCISNNAVALHTPAVGVSCLAKYSKDEGWYRATIKQLLDVGKMEVLFVDYGNSEVIDSSEVKAIIPDFLALPAQAVECQLHGVPPSFDPEVTDKFQQLIDGASEIMAKIEKIHNGVLTVSLFSQSDDEEVNIFASIFGTLPSISSSAEEEFVYLMPEVPAGDHLGYIASFNNPSDFFIQLTVHDANLEQLADQISKKYQSGDECIPLNTIKLGMACCAKYSKDQEWYRAQVMDIQDDSITVLFVDYGNTDTVSSDSLRCLDKIYLQVPPFAIPCQLANIHPVGDVWTKEAVDKLNDYMDEQLSITFMEQALPCPVCIQKDGKSLSDDLVELNFAVLKKESIFESLSAEKTEIRTGPETLAFGDIATNQRILTVSKLSAVICFVESWEKIFITAVDWNKELDDLMLKLGEVYDLSQESSLLLSDIEVGQWCAARYSADGSWYRAAVIEKDGNSVHIRFIDYGNKEKTVIEELRCLKPEFLKYPPYAVECYLDKINPVEGKESDITAKLQHFSDSFQDLQFEVQLDEIPYKVQLTTANGNFLSDLISEGLAVSSDLQPQIVNAAYPQRTISVNKLSVTMCFVDSWNEFYVTPVECAAELSTLMDMLKEQYEDKDCTSLSLSTVQQWQPCAAKYNADNMWYRAVVNDVDGDTVFLNFVDYGNSEVASIHEIKKLVPELINFPPFALKCHLYGFVPATGAEDMIVSKLQTFVDEEETLEIEIIESCGTSYLVKIANGGNFVQKLTDEGLGVEGNNSIEEHGKTDAFNEDMEHNFEETHEQDIAVDLEFAERKISCGKLEARIAYVDAWDKFYITATDWEQELLSLKNDLSSHYANKDNDPYGEIYEGQIGIFVNENQNCYRVIVQKIEGDDIWVQCVDYGKLLVIKSNALKQLSPEFMNIPPFSVECRLSELLPVQGAEADITDKLQTFVVEKTKIEVQILNHDVPYDVRIKTDIDFVTQLVHEGLATAELPSPERLHARETFKDNLKIAFVDDLSDEMAKYQISPQSLTCDKIVGILQHCEIRNGHPVLYVVPSDLLPALEDFQMKLQTIYDDTSSSSAMAISKGDYCVAKFPTDNCWYRAKVMKKTDDSLLVKSVDYGSAELVTVDDVRKPVVEFSDIPQYSVECCMLGVCVNENCDEHVESKLLEFESDWTLHLCQIPSHNSANHSCISKAEVSGLDVVEFLIQENLVKQVFPVVNDLKIFQCCVLAVDEDLTFHLLPHDWIEKRNMVQQSLKSTYESFKRAEFSELQASRLYAAQKDSVWYRSFIHSIEDATALVRFVDFGTIESLHAADLCILYPNFCHLSAFCIQGHLDGLPKVVNTDLQQKILDIVKGKDVTSVVSGFEHSTNRYYVHLTVNGKDLMELLDLSNELLSQSVGLENECSGETEAISDEGLIHSVDNSITLSVEEPVEDILLEKQVQDKSDQQLKLSDQFQEDPDFDEFVTDTQQSEACAENQEVSEDELDKFDLGPSVCEKQTKDSSETFVEQQEVSGERDMESFESCDEEQDAYEIKNLEQEVSEIKNLEQEVSVIQKVQEDISVTQSVEENVSATENVEKDISGAQNVEEDISGAQNVEEDIYGNQNVVEGVSVTQNVEQEVYEKRVLESSEELETDELHAQVLCDFKGEEINLSTSTIVKTNISDNNETSQILEQGEYNESGAETSTNLINTSCIPEKLTSSLVGDFSDLPHLSENSGGTSNDTTNTSGYVEDEVHPDPQLSLCEKQEEEFFPEEARCDQSSLELNEEAEKKILEEVDLTLETAHSVCSEESFVLAYFQTERELPVGIIDVSILDFKAENSDIFMSVIPVALMTELEELQSDLQSHYTSKVVSESSKIGRGPCAILSDENVWHRGEVYDIISDAVTVSYWDMDLKCVTINTERVRKLHEKFCFQLPYCVMCTIPSAKCCDGDTVIRKLRDQLKGKVLSVETLGGHQPVPVKLLDDGNIIQQLLSADLLTLEIPPHAIYSGEHLANISYIDDLSGLSIYIQWVDQLENLRQLREKMQLEYDKKENGVRLDDATSVGMYAVKNNDVWERCKVLTADDTVLFYFIDTGECKEAVDTVLQPLLFDFILDPPYAYQCHIFNLPPIPEDIISEVTLALQEVSLDRKLFATILERNEYGFYSVYLTVDKEDVLQWLKKLEKLSDDLKMILEQSSVQCDKSHPGTQTVPEASFSNDIA